MELALTIVPLAFGDGFGECRRVHSWRGYIYESLGQTQNARSDWDEACELDNNMVVLNVYGVVVESKGR